MSPFEVTLEVFDAVRGGLQQGGPVLLAEGQRFSAGGPGPGGHLVLHATSEGLACRCAPGARGAFLVHEGSCSLDALRLHVGRLAFEDLHQGVPDPYQGRWVVRLASDLATYAARPVALEDLELQVPSVVLLPGLRVWIDRAGLRQSADRPSRSTALSGTAPSADGAPDPQPMLPRIARLKELLSSARCLEDLRVALERHVGQARARCFLYRVAGDVASWTPEAPPVGWTWHWPGGPRSHDASPAAMIGKLLGRLASRMEGSRYRDEHHLRHHVRVALADDGQQARTYGLEVLRVQDGAGHALLHPLGPVDGMVVRQAIKARYTALLTAYSHLPIVPGLACRARHEDLRQGICATFTGDPMPAVHAALGALGAAFDRLEAARATLVELCPSDKLEMVCDTLVAMSVPPHRWTDGPAGARATTLQKAWTRNDKRLAALRHAAHVLAGLAPCWRLDDGLQALLLPCGCALPLTDHALDHQLEWVPGPCGNDRQLAANTASLECVVDAAATGWQRLGVAVPPARLGLARRRFRTMLAAGR